MTSRAAGSSTWPAQIWNVKIAYNNRFHPLKEEDQLDQILVILGAIIIVVVLIALLFRQKISVWFKFPCGEAKIEAQNPNQAPHTTPSGSSDEPATSSAAPGVRSVSIGRSGTETKIVTGDHSKVE